MFKLKQSLVAFVGLMAFVGLIALVTPLAGRGQGNSDNAPPASDVNVVNTPSVNVVNPATSPALVRDIDRQAMEPDRDTVTFALSNGESSGTAALDAVPAGKRLVVEYATARAILPPGQMAAVRLVVGGASYELPVIPQGTFGDLGGAVLVGSEPVRLYVEAGERVGVAALRTDDNLNGFVTVSISGHLVNVP